MRVRFSPSAQTTVKKLLFYNNDFFIFYFVVYYIHSFHISSPMKTLITIWASVVGTFAFITVLLLRNQESINAPGELGEVLFGLGAELVVAL